MNMKIESGEQELKLKIETDEWIYWEYVEA